MKVCVDEYGTVRLVRDCKVVLEQLKGHSIWAHGYRNAHRWKLSLEIKPSNEVKQLLISNDGAFFLVCNKSLVIHT